MNLQKLNAQLKQSKTFDEIGYKDVGKLNLPTFSSYLFGVELEFLSLYDYDEIIGKVPSNSRFNLVRRARTDTQYAFNNDFRIVHDGSVLPSVSDTKWINNHVRKRKNSKIRVLGHEIATPILNCSKLHLLEECCKLLNSVDNSGIPIGLVNPTCGLHINVNISGLSKGQKQSIYYTWKEVEKYICDIIPIYRRKSKYCKSVKGLPYHERITKDKYYSITEKTNLNVFEYRLFNGTLHFDTIKHMIYIVLSVYDYGLSHNVTYKTSLDLYSVIKNPILRNFYNSRRKFIDNLSTEASLNIGTRNKIKAPSRVLKVRL